jgi:hypothetical protein
MHGEPVATVHLSWRCKVSFDPKCIAAVEPIKAYVIFFAESQKFLVSAFVVTTGFPFLVGSQRHASEINSKNPPSFHPAGYEPFPEF